MRLSNERDCAERSIAASDLGWFAGLNVNSWRRVALGAAVVLLVMSHAALALATCWQTRDAKGRVNGECCQARGGPQSCRTYSAARIQAMAEARRRLMEKGKVDAEKRRKLNLVRDRLTKERNARLGREALERQQARELWQKNYPEAYQRQLATIRARQANQARRRRQAKLARERRARAAERLRAEPRWARHGFWEVGLGLSGQILTGNDGRVGPAGGVAGSASLFWRGKYNGASMLGKGSLGIAAIPLIGPLMGFFAVPGDTLLGNEWGVTLRVDADWSRQGTARPRMLILAAPRLRMTPNNSPWRMNSLLGILVPQIGVEFDDRGASHVVLEAMNLAYARVLTEHIGLELCAGILVRRRDGKNQAGLHVTLALLHVP